MGNFNVRKGIFETSSSSEDSVTVYEQMKMYGVKTELFNRFINGEVMFKFGNSDSIEDIEYLENEYAMDRNIRLMYEKSEKNNHEYSSDIEKYKNNGTIAWPFRCMKHDLYFTYRQFADVFGNEYYEYTPFSETIGEYTVFGVYGYNNE